MKNNTLLLINLFLFIYLFVFVIIIYFFTGSTFPRTAEHTMMRFMLQTLCPLENASFKTNDPRRPWCAMVLSDTHRDARASISPSRLV